MIRLSAVLRHVALAFVCIAITRPTSVGFAAMAKAQGDNGVAVITGKMRVTNPFILEDAAEPYVALIDLTALVKRDRTLPLPFADQTLAGLQGDLATGATFTLPLPIEPRGVLNEVSHGQAKGQGVRLFSVDFETNAIGDPFQGPYEWHGWPTDLDSLRFEAASGAVTGGRLLVLAADDQGLFPTRYRPHRPLFRAHDPPGPPAAGLTGGRPG